jgi:predicted DNA binding protein
MSVLLRFTIDADAFELGRVLAVPPGMAVELDRIVPTGQQVVPFVWATGPDHEGVAESVRAHTSVDSFTALDRFGQTGLYRLDWREGPGALLGAIEQSEAALLDARGGRAWRFRLRFSDTDQVPQFHDMVREAGLPVNVEQTQQLSDHGEDTSGLSEKQRTALTLAVRRGYFASPSEVGLEKLAEELDITRQALSKRIRRGNETILEHLLLSSSHEP